LRDIDREEGFKAAFKPCCDRADNAAHVWGVCMGVRERACVRACE
jgi:hypothetical protein